MGMSEAEPSVDRFPFAIALREVAPMGAGAQNPEATIDKQTIIRACPPGSRALPGNREAFNSYRFTPTQKPPCFNAVPYEAAIN